MSNSAGFCRNCEWSFENDERNWQIEETEKTYIPKSVEKVEEEIEKQIYIYA